MNLYHKYRSYAESLVTILSSSSPNTKNLQSSLLNITLYKDRIQVSQNPKKFSQSLDPTAKLTVLQGQKEERQYSMYDSCIT